MELTVLVGDYVAMQSLDGTKEFIHVLKSGIADIKNSTLKLLKPLDGKVFKKATLLNSNIMVSLKTSKDGILSIIFPTSFKWDELDTVIVLM